MPKEITHLAIAQKVRQKLTADSLFADAVNRFPNLFFYGTIAPDTCFFYLFGPHMLQVQTACQPLHVSCSNALKPVLKFLGRHKKNESEILAFAAGICSHLMADTNFHPMVYFFAGSDDLHEGATARHRMFETAMDVHFDALFKEESIPRPYLVMNGLEVQAGRVISWLINILGIENAPCSGYMLQSFRYHGIACRLFANHQVYRFLKACRRMKLGVPDKIEAVFYPFDKPVRLKFFEQTLEYQDPETGVRFRETVESLAEKAVGDTLRILSVLESNMGEGGSIENSFLDDNLPQIRPCPLLGEKSFLYWYGSDKLKNEVYGEARL